MGAFGVAILAARGKRLAAPFGFSVEDVSFKTREVSCGQCPNNYRSHLPCREDELIDSWRPL